MDSQLKRLTYKIIRQGLTFGRILKELEASQYYSVEQLESLQNEKLRKLVSHCYKNVPYYTELFDKLKIKPEDIKTKEDLQKLPFMDKNTIRQNYGKLIATNIPRFLGIAAETSGTTGTPTKFLRDYYSVNFENAALYRFRKWSAGKSLKQVTLRGDVVVPVTQNTPPFWKYYPLNHELVMSSYHLSKDYTGIYFRKIKEFAPDILFGFPSSVSQLAKNLLETGERIKLGAVFTSSETLSERQRKIIEEAFMCRVSDWYGQVERVSAIGQCEKGTYHIVEDYSITETIQTDYGMEIVGTNLNNYIMPILRFRTSDIVELGQTQCTCGRNFRTVSKIHGRAVNYILSPEGNKISLFLVSDSIDYDNNVDQIQFVQERKGELTLNVIKNAKFSERDRMQIIHSIREHTSPDMKVAINEVDSIPRGPNGKVIDSIIRLE